MVERLCRACQAGNPLDATVCQQCAAPFEGAAPLARREPASLAARVRRLPVLRSPAARSVALGLTALALDVGASLLKQRKERQQPPSTDLAPRAYLQVPRRRAMLRQRVWEEFNADGSVRRRVVENLVIRDE